MSILTTLPENSPYFTLDISQRPSHTQIKMILLTETVNTKDLPKTYEFLEKALPSILRSKCYNKENLPFFQEVRQTEIGHLFEHMLLEYLCKLKVQKGYKKATYSGKTCWNWLKDPKGTFHIKTNTKAEDTEILQEAIKHCSELMQTLLKEGVKPEKQYKQVIQESPAYMLIG